MTGVAVQNQNMKNPPLNVGIITPPDRFNKPTLYSHVKATRDFNKLSEDIYVSVKKSESYDKRKTPKSVYAILSAIGLTSAFFIIKKCLKKK